MIRQREEGDMKGGIIIPKDKFKEMKKQKKMSKKTYWISKILKRGVNQNPQRL